MSKYLHEVGMLAVSASGLGEVSSSGCVEVAADFDVGENLGDAPMGYLDVGGVGNFSPDVSHGASVFDVWRRELI